ncbi:hypothetical protein VE02_09925 [Pseudogymnoascus sp. 03VT05]|nr:hypothetical protein VE02_09925 [Pseudogymnoascus sp. 03VT05]
MAITSFLNLIEEQEDMEAEEELSPDEVLQEVINEHLGVQQADDEDDDNRADSRPQYTIQEAIKALQVVIEFREGCDNMKTAHLRAIERLEQELHAEAITRRLAAEGYAVTINDIAANKAGADRLAAKLNETYGDGTSTGTIADVTSPLEVKSMIDESVRQLGPLTVMIANAGIAGVGATLDLSYEDVAQIMNVNFTGVWYCYTHAARQMIAQGPVPEGSTRYKILGASSIAAYKPCPLLAHYCASKGAVRSPTQVFAIEMA